MGWDAFGLPAENAAQRARERDPDADVTPESYTRECIGAMREAFEDLGMGFDWSREVATCDPEYYRWNQWLFARLRDAGLVDRRDRELNWCPDCETVLADEQVEESEGSEVCWRCETPIVDREMEQWFFAITEYADELLDELEDLEGWPASVRDQQRNWIGRTEGAEVDFTVHVPETDPSIDGDASDGDATVDHDVTAFTTRLDTIHGATYFALAPDHPLAEAAAERDPEVREFVAETADSEGSEPQGVRTEMTATNPVTGEEMPVYVANFVLSDVGTGALMAVPAHDDRDHAFASTHGIEIRQVVTPESDDQGEERAAADAVDGEGRAAADTVDVQASAFTEDGVLVNSGEYDGLASEAARDALVDDLASAEPAVQYRLRDWGISRQRYWGTPIPVVHCPNCGPVTVPESDLPVELPEFVASTGNPLDAAEDWKRTECPDCGEQAVRETDTMDTFVGSSWYYARFAGGPEAVPDAPDDRPFDAATANAWLPVDEYVGGSEHAVMHLLYARFVAKALRDLDRLDVDEPFDGLTTQGMVLGEDGRKMSKSRDNGVSPARIVETYGADTARAFVLGAAEPEREFAWNPEGVERRRRLLDRVHALARKGPAVEEGDASTVDRDLSPTDAYVARELDATVDAVTDAYGEMRFDLALRDVDALVSLLERYRATGEVTVAVLARATSVVVRLLAPIAPHVCEQAWTELGGADAPDAADAGFVATAAWPTPERDLGGYDAGSRLVERTREDVRDIVDTAGIDDPERIVLAVAPEWTYRALELARDAVGDAGGDPGEVTSAVMADDAMRERGDAAAAYARELADEDVLPTVLGPERERATLRRAAWLVEREFDAPVDVLPAEDASTVLLDRARPGRPAIHVEED